MSEDFVMPPDPFLDGLDYSGPDTSGPFNLSDLNTQQTKPAAPALPYDERLAQYQEQGGTSSTNPLVRGARRGFLTGFASDLGFLETASDIVGDVGKDKFKSGGDFLTELANEVPRRQLNEIEDFGDALDYFGQAVGEVFGQIGSIIPTAIATGGTGAVARVLGKETLKGAGKRAAAKRGAAAVGAFVGRSSMIRGIGGTYRGVREDTGVESPFLAVPFGVASGMAERFGLGKTFESFFEALPRTSKELLWKQVLSSGMKAAGRSAIVEGGTEAIQESLQLTASKLADNTFDLVNGNNLWRVADAAVTGALGAVPLGAAGGAGNYISSTPSQETDNNLTTTVNSRVDKTIPDKRLTKQVSMTLFRGMQEKLSRLESNLTDPEFIPTDQDIQELESATNAIPNYGVMSESQKQGLLNVANSTLDQYRERAKSVKVEEEAAQAEQQSEIQIAARKNREAAEQQAMPQGVLPEGVTREVILPESDAPYNKPENTFVKNQSYEHALESGEIVVARITDARNGRVREAVLDSDDTIPLITTFNNKTFDLHSEDEIKRAAILKDKNKFGGVDSSVRIADNNNFIAQQQEKNVRAQQIREQNEKIAQGDPLKIKGTRTRRARRVNIPKGQKVTTKTTTTYTPAEPKTISGVSARQANRTNAANKEKTLNESTYVRVKKQGAKRVVGKLQNVKVIDPDAPNQQFEAEVLLKNGKKEPIIITSVGKGQFTTQASMGSVELIANKGKLTKDQETEVSGKEQFATPEPTATPKPRATVETKPFDPRPTTRTNKSLTQPQETKKVSLTKQQTKKDKPDQETKPETETTTEVAGREIKDDNAFKSSLDEAQEQWESGLDEVLSFEQFVFKSFQLLRLQVLRAAAYIHQLYLDNKISSDFNKNSRGYKARRKEFVDKHLKEIEASAQRDEVYTHLPSMTEDGKQFLEGLFDAAVEKYSKVDKNKLNQNARKELEDSIQNPEYIKNFIDTPIKEDGDSERTVILANSKVFQGELGFQIENLKLYNDDLQDFQPVVDFAMSRKKPVVSIKVLGPSTDAVAYTLREDLLDQVRLQKSVVRKGTAVYAHIPESLFVDSKGNFQFDNWTVNKKKAPARFIKDISWIGLESDELIGLISERSKGTELESLLNSERGASILGSRVEVAGIIGSGLRLAKDGKRYTPVSDQGKIAKEKLAEKDDAKLANLNSDQLVENLKYAIDIHLDHFNSLTSKQINESDRSALELKRLNIYRRKLNQAIEGNLPQTINLYKLDGDFKNTNKFYVQAVDRTGRVIKQRRQSLTDEVKKEAKKDLVRIDNRIKELKSAKISDDTKMINLVAGRLSGIEDRYDWPLDYVIKKLTSIDSYFEEGGDINDAFEVIYAYTALAEQEKFRFLEENRTSLPSETAEEYDALSDLEGKISQTSVEEDTGITTEEEQAGDAVIARERIEELNKFIEGRFEETTDIGRASRKFRDARKKLLDLLQSEDENDPKFNEKVTVAQTEILESMNYFLESKGTDFIEGNTNLSVELFNLFLDVKKENIANLDALSIYESKQKKIDRQVNLLNIAKKDLDEKGGIQQSFIRSIEDIVAPIRRNFKERMQSEIDQVYAIPEEREALEEQGFVNKSDKTKKVLQDSDVTVEKLLNNPRFNIRLTPEERSILEENAPHIEAYNKAKLKFEGLRTGLAMLDVESAAVYGFSVEDNKYGLMLDQKLYLSLSAERRELLKKQQQLNNAKKNRASKRLYPHERDELIEVKTKLSRVEFKIKRFDKAGLTDAAGKFIKPTNKALAKRSGFYKHVFDSFISGGVRNTNAGAMFGYMVGLANKFNEDQFRETGLFTRIAIPGSASVKGGANRVETPASLYYKLYKSFEIRDALKLLSHPSFMESRLYVGPVRPNWHRKQERDARSKNVEKAGLQKSKYYLASMDEGIISGPYNTQKEVLKESLIEYTEENMVREFGTLTIKVPRGNTLDEYIVGKGSDLELQGFNRDAVRDAARSFVGEQESWDSLRERRRVQIVNKLNEYKTPKEQNEKGLDDTEANKAYIKDFVLKGLINDYITLFTAEAGYDLKRSAVIKNATGFSSRMKETLDSLAEGLNMPFMPKEPESKELSENRVSAEQLEEALASAKQKRAKANELFARYQGEFDTLKRQSRFKTFDKSQAAPIENQLSIATKNRDELNNLLADYRSELSALKRKVDLNTFEKGETAEMVQAQIAPVEKNISNALNSIENANEEISLIRQRLENIREGLFEEDLANVEENYNQAKQLLQEARQEERLLEQKKEDLVVEKGVLLGQAIEASSLDLIQGKDLSVTISQTLPYGYNKVKGNRRSMDKAIQSSNHWESPADGQLLSEQSRVDAPPVTLGSAKGPDEIAQVLEENRDALGSDAVDRALDILATLPEKYLEELSLVVQSSVSTDGGLKLGGSFVEALKTVFIPVDGNTTESFTHELMHYMHAFLPQDFQERVSAMRKDALKKVANNTEDGKLRYRIQIASELLNMIEGNESMSVDGFQQMLDKYGDKASDMYHLINDNEFFVYLMTNEGVNDMQSLSPEQNPVGFIARARRFLADLFKRLVDKVSGRRNAPVSFRDEVMDKFKSGDFSLERRKFTAGPELDASLLTSRQVKKAAELNVRNAILTPEGGANVEAGRKLSLEAGAYHNFIYDLSQKILTEMGESGEFANILGSPDEQVKLSKRAQTFAKIKESEAVRMFLEENEQTTGGVIFSPEGYLGLLEQRERNPKAIPESVWQQISNEFFKNTEYFLRSHRERLAKLEKLKGEKQEEKILAKLNEASEEYDTSQIARNAASSLSSTIGSLLEHAKLKALEGETLKRLESYGFNSSLLSDQLDRFRGREALSKRGDLIKLGNDFYETVWFNAEAQIILHKGKTSSGKKATWEDLVRTYMRSKGIKRITDVQPITKMLADHILRIHQNEIEMKDIDQKMLEDSFGVYNDYEKEIYALMTKGKNGSKKAFDKIMKDFKSAAGEEAVANKLYLSIRRDVRKEIKLMNDATIAAELMGRIIESDEFKNARQAAAQEIDAKPNRDITIGEQEIFFPHPNKEEDFRMTYDVSDKLGREKQLEGLALYVQSMNDWLLENQPDPENNKAGDPYFEFWKETRDIASATMLSPTMRSGQSMKAALEFNLLRPLQNLLSGIGTFTSKLALTHMDNLSMTMERTSQWKAKHEQKVVNALQAAAKSHGFTADPIGIEDWFHNVGERYFATANFEGRALKVGDKVTTSDKTDVKTITKEDEEALKTQVAAFDELFNMDVKRGRGALIRKRKTTDEVKGVRIMDAEGRKVPLTIGRKALKVTELTLPKTFSSKSVRMSRSISDLVKEKKTEITDIDSTDILTEKEKRQQKLILFKTPNRRGDSIYSLIAEEFDRFVFAFLDNREGKITDGTSPYFTEGVYDEARDAMLNGDITNMEQLANFFADRSVDPEKIGDTDQQFQLSDEEALFELLREMSVQADRFRDFIDPKLEDDESSVQYKFVKLKTDSAFTTARQEPIANYYYYKYGVDETVGMSNMEVESSSQYIDSLISALKGVEGELDNAANEKKIASERGNLEEFMEGKKQSAANKESFLDYERVEAQKASVSQIINDLNAVRERDVRYELQVNRTWRRMVGDLIGVAIQMPTTALANLIGTPVRSAMRMQALFGFAPALNARFAVDAIKELAKGAATFGTFGMRGAYAGAKLLVKGKPLKGFAKFVDEFANKPFTTDLMFGQHKINSTLRRLVDAGYGMRIDVQGKIDAHLDSPETRGRIERATDIKQRGAIRRSLSNWYNNAAFFLSEVPGMITPRFFDAVGNNISFRFANTAVSNIEMRLKDLHRKYGDSLWDRYNDPDVLARDSEKMDTLTPTDAFGDQFLFGPDESSLGKLERLFTNGGVDFHAEALRFYKQLDQDKEATFLSPEQRAEIGIGMVTAENLATIANRPLKFRNDPNVGFLFALSGWSLSAAHNSIEYLGKAQGGKRGWGINSLNLNMAMVLLGMAAISGVSFAGQEELFRLIYKYLFGEVKTGRHPWEADSGSEATRRALLYSLSAFPIVNAPFNLMLNDQKGVAAFGMDFFIQSKAKNILNAAGQIANTRNAEGVERAVLILSKQIYPNSRVLVNRFPAISGIIDLINNTRLIRRYAPKDMVKESNYTGGSATASPLTPVVSKMTSLAVQGRYDEMVDLYRKAIKMAADMNKPDPVRYIQSMYFAKDPYRSGLKGRVNDAFKLRITEKMSDEERREFFRVENNFYRGYAVIGGKRRTSTPSFRISTSTNRRTRRRVRPAINPLPESYLPRSARPAPLRRAYGV